MIRILTIDGGGIRGILPGQLLVRLEKLIQKKTGNSSAKIGDYFDMVAGTSTGSILTTFILRPGEDGKAKYHAKEAVDLYIDKGDEIFHRSIGRAIKTIGGITDEKYSAENIEAILKDKLGEDVWLSDLISPCLVPTYDIENRKARFFNQIEAVKNPHYNFKLWEVARATSAAPTYFEPKKIKSESGNEYNLVDGGVFANNPALCAYVETREHFKNDLDQHVSAKDMFLVSIGTGSVKKPYMYDKAKDWGLAEWLKPLVDIMMSGSSETVDYQLGHIFDSENVRNQYVRFEPSLGAADTSIDDVSKQNLQALKLAGEESADVYQDALDKVADQLIKLDAIV